MVMGNESPLELFLAFVDQLSILLTADEGVNQEAFISRFDVVAVDSQASRE